MSDDRTGGDELPRLTEDEIKARLRSMLNRLGDFSAYVELDDSDNVVIKTFAFRPGCVTLPAATLVAAGAGVKDRWLGVAVHSIELLSRAIEDRGDMDYAQVAAACITPDRLKDEAMTAAVASGPFWDEEPAPTQPGAQTLPRLTPDEIKKCAILLLQDYGDMAAYVTRDAGADKVVLNVVSPKSSFVLPAPTQPKTPVAKDKLGEVTYAVQRLNGEFIDGKDGFDESSCMSRDL